MDRRFHAVGRLFSEAGLARLAKATVCVVGLGGVGSWTVESLARSGIGALRLVDLDEICISNVNRQIHAVEGNLGKSKARAMAERARIIHPEIRVEVVEQFFTSDTELEVLGGDIHAVVDAIDSVTNKCRLARACFQRGLPLVISGGAGGRMDPGRIRMGTLEDASHDRLLAGVRRQLKKDCPREEWECLLQTPAVYSTEPVSHGPDAGCDSVAPGRNCESGFGSLASVTGTYGLAAAAWVVRHLALDSPSQRSLLTRP